MIDDDRDPTPLRPTGIRLPAGGGPPVHVASLTGFGYRSLLHDLTEWVEALVARHSIDIRTIPPCWARHPAIVEALSALRDHERGSFAANAPPGAAVDWLRALHDVLGLVRDHAALTGCTASEHRAPPTRTTPSTSPITPPDRVLPPPPR